MPSMHLGVTTCAANRAAQMFFGYALVIVVSKGTVSVYKIWLLHYQMRNTTA